MSPVVRSRTAAAILAVPLALALNAPALALAAPPDPAPATSAPATSASSVAAPDAEEAATKSIGFYVGKDLTEDGATLLGGFGHEPSSHWLEIVPRRSFPEGATTTVGITAQASDPGELIEIPQVRETYRYVTSNYSEFAGFPAPLTNGGLNEHGVAARDIWSPTAQRLRAFTEDPQLGPNYSDLSRLAMERATTAREAVEVVGGLIDEHGYSSYGGNSHLFADADEGWVFVNYAGNQKLWAAQRLGPDEVRVSFPGYLEPFPLDFRDRPDEYLASPNLVDFAVEQGWFDPEDAEEFDVQAIYGGFTPNQPSVTPTHPGGQNNQGELEAELSEQLAPVSLEDLLAYVRDPRWSHDRSGYGHVAELRADVVDPDLEVLWAAVTGSVTTPYVPIHLGADDVPPEFKQHRYLTSNAASTHIAADYAPLEATRYATRTFKRLMYHTCENPETYLAPVTAELERFEGFLLDEQADLHRRVQRLLDRGDRDGARELLTSYTEDRLLRSLDLGEALVAEVEARTRATVGIRMPTGRDLPGETYRPESQSMNRGGGLTGDANAIVHCLHDELPDLPRLHGSHAALAGDLVRQFPPRQDRRPERPQPPVRPGEVPREGRGVQGNGLAAATPVGTFVLGLVAAGALRRRRGTFAQDAERRTD